MWCDAEFGVNDINEEKYNQLKRRITWLKRKKLKLRRKRKKLKLRRKRKDSFR